MTLPKGHENGYGKYWVTYSGDSSHPKNRRSISEINLLIKKERRILH
jgi:hypothetical protein